MVFVPYNTVITYNYGTLSILYVLYVYIVAVTLKGQSFTVYLFIYLLTGKVEQSEGDSVSGDFMTYNTLNNW